MCQIAAVSQAQLHFEFFFQNIAVARESKKKPPRLLVFLLISF